MIYYIFKHQIFTVFLSLSHLTAITFSDRVTDYVGGMDADFKIYELNKGRSLVFEPKRKEVDRNFLVFLKDGKYHFNIKYADDFSNKDIEIQEAKACDLFELIEEKNEYQLFACPKSMLFVNKLKTPVRVNEQNIDGNSRVYLSKGPPIYLEGKMIYYGRPL
ncbi:MAG: hypothetical protein A2504_00380 [Bdellovibrionales bacterium RIFOXYD12_FULL_39_22]|nr:MAG: hypothetical protein A2385_13960 [Bdellovibrionales bacterium RIFOXYB1_FULL_39_21]OFZ42437.1 MAG: hypothetical protein A2485_04010 [Bdellovibrionales bacterium RIFOXYC12_FULL_39_17]OFZ45413.1 MAG: hypothetical protein A2404_01450 [Bdellovibrionales bacterium RIFOXYC1_FULL_39_130]OFZ68427.1 MAG: hypothetical protein A2451_01595 [Bdellovibrionales bacterium RIFOXYC2_FULL_39_8]OFZ74610.1 MAG: hypothetical protein A2560_09480 [Bdellovibrionales bacterium RIFOXYD1_FULL_39_84]OFZ92892.1 MAG: